MTNLSQKLQKMSEMSKNIDLNFVAHFKNKQEYFKPK